MTSDTLVLVDGSSYLYRAYHALPSLTSSSGQPTGAIHGVINMLRRLRADIDPRYIAVVFDAKGRTFRDDWYPAYKATRPPMPDDLQAQIEPLHQLIAAMGLPLLVIDGVEADDVIGTLATRAAGDGLRVVISAADKDFAQLVSERISLANTLDGTLLDPAGVRAKFGVPPPLIVDYLTLIGDTVDNVPGVPKVGPKTAVKWLTQYGDLDGVITHAAEISGKIGDHLRHSLEQIPLSRKLVTIITDLDLGVGPSALVPGPPHRGELIELLRRLELNSWLRQVLAEPPSVGAPVVQDSMSSYETILEQAKLDAWIVRLGSAALIAIDTETTSLDYIEARIVGLSFATEPGAAAYVPLAHRYPGAPAQLALEAVLAQLRPLLENPALPKVGQNLKYDRSVLLNHGIELRGIKYDTMLESYVLNSTATRHDLDSLALKYLGRQTIRYEDVAGKGVKQVCFDQVSVEQAGPYAAEDADVCLQLHRELWPRIARDPALASLFHDIEVPLVAVLSTIERNGVLIDADMLRTQSGELAARLDEIEREAHALAGESFNIGSPRQIQRVLYEKLGLPVTEKTPSGQPSTAESALQELAVEFPLPRLILDYRALSKLKSTYTDRLPLDVNPRTGRIHTSYHQAVAATGRLSSSDPNLQNIPVRTEEGRRIRQAFIAPAGRQLLAADYSQIELRIMAHLSGDERLRAAFAAGSDIHRATAAEVFGVELGAVGDEQRRAAKAINFGLMYGMSAFGLARQLGIDRVAAQTYIERYFARYPGIKAYMERIRAQARQAGYVETLFGRRLHLPEINSPNAQRRQYAERTAINAPMQGTAADIIKRAMIGVDQWIRDRAAPALLTMQVHDELVLEVDDGAAAETAAAVNRIMAGAAALAVPLVVDVGLGKNWHEAH